MKKIILLIFIFPLFSKGQESKHIFYGIDLNLDWYSLTNYSKLTYFTIDSENTEDNYVCTNFEYFYDNIDPTFMNLGFTEMVLCFPKGMQSNLKILKPELLIARIKYKSINEFKMNSKNDFEKIFKLIKSSFNAPDSNLTQEMFSLHKWNEKDFEIALHSHEEDLTITLIYLKTFSQDLN